MRKTVPILAVATTALLAASGLWTPSVSHGQITFRNIDPKRMGYVPLQKPIQPSMPFMPHPGLQQENIRPDRMEFDLIPKDNITFQDLRQNRIEVAPLVQDELVQQPIAPQWEDRAIRGPEKMEPQPLMMRDSFEFKSPMFLPATRLQPGMDDSMFRTPSLFDERPPTGTPTENQARQAAAAANSWLRPTGRPQGRDGRQVLGW